MNPTPLTDSVLARLRALASANGATGEIIQLIGTEERAAELHGTMILTPHVEAQGGRQAGKTGGKKVRTFRNFAELRNYMEQQRKDFTGDTGWYDAIRTELEKIPGHGWGVEDMRFELEERTEFLSATEHCPECGGKGASLCATCHGNRSLPCNQCQARGQENCPACGGGGIQPGTMQQPCLTCRGTRVTPCRICQGRGQVMCPSCNGTGGTQCPTCSGSGQITESGKLIYSVEAAFSISSGADLPSSIRRALDRSGLALMGKGHADISFVREQDKSGERIQLHYTAAFPLAELTLGIMNRRVHVTAFGKRLALLDVPAFLDITLKGARKALTAAAEGRSEFLAEACEGKVIADAFTLVLGGQRRPVDLVRQYPIALSRDAAAEIMRNMTLALKNLTLKARWAIAGISAVFAAGLFATLFFTPVLAGLEPMVRASLEIAVPILFMLAGWFLVGQAGRYALNRRFGPTTDLNQKIVTPPPGKIGLTAMALVLLAYLLLACLGTYRPVWLEWLITLFSS